MELLEVLRWCVDAHRERTVGEMPACPETRNLFNEPVVRRFKLESDGDLVDLFDNSLLPVDGHPGSLAGVQFVVAIHVLEPEHDVIGCERVPI